MISNDAQKPAAHDSTTLLEEVLQKHRSNSQCPFQKYSNSLKKGGCDA